MLEQSVKQPVSPSRRSLPPQDESLTPSGSGVRLMMPLALLGTIIVIVALLFFRWPSTTSPDLNKASSHFDRIASALSGAGAVFPNAVMDASVYIMVVVSVLLIVSAFRRGARSPLNGLMVIGLLGLAYAGGMALYTGPMVSICGFMLILFGGAIAWIASENDTLPQPAASKESAVPIVTATPIGAAVAEPELSTGADLVSVDAEPPLDQLDPGAAAEHDHTEQ